MKKIIFLFALIALPLLASAQHDGKYYLYNIVNFEGKLKNEGFKVTVDNGKTIEKLRDDNGKRIVFTTPAGALIYFASQGWELYTLGATSDDDHEKTSTYWILRKSCSKEEFDEAVKNSIVVKTPIEQ